MKNFTLLIYSMGALLTFSMHSMEKPKKAKMTIDPAQYRLLERLDQAIRGSADDTAQIPALLQQITVNLLTPLRTNDHHHTILHSAVSTRDTVILTTIITAVREQVERHNAHLNISPYDSRFRTPYMLAQELGDDGKEILKKLHELFPEKDEEFEDELEQLQGIAKKARQSQEGRNVRAERLAEISKERAIATAQQRKEARSKRHAGTPHENCDSTDEHHRKGISWAPGENSVTEPNKNHAASRPCWHGASAEQRQELVTRETYITPCIHPVVVCTALFALMLYFTYLASAIQPTIQRNLP